MNLPFQEKSAFQEEGLCQMCKKGPAEHLGLACSLCKGAMEDGEAWTLQHEDLLLQLQEMELEEQYR